MSRALVILFFLPVLCRAEIASWDWREALLAEEGIAMNPEAIRQALASGAAPPANLESLMRRRGSDDFAERERAQKELRRGGDPVYRWLRNRPPHPEPEVRQRVQNILRSFSLKEQKDREDALDFALRSLLEEGNQRRKDTGGRFYEWFGEDATELVDRYHLLQFKSSVDRNGQIAQNQLCFFGTKVGDGDQRMILSSKLWPGKDDFGDSFTVTTRLGGEPKAAGSWHLGVSIGNVRVLYHPGYRGGGFRFETVDENLPLGTMTANMGFEPPGSPLERMIIEVRRLPAEKVALTVAVISGGENPITFKQSAVVPQKQIGPLDHIGLDRSGRSGGLAFFADFSVTLNE